jgi:hypothetical protein
MKLIGLMILLTPLWWLLGLKPIIIQLSLLLLFIFYNKNIFNVQLSKESISLFVIVLIYCISVLININNIPLDRLIGTIYNLSIWLCGFLLIVFITNVRSKKNVILVSRSIIFITCLSCLIGVVGLVLFYFGTNNFSIISPLLSIFPSDIVSRSEILKSSSQILFVRPDFTFLGKLPRSAGFFEYPNALALSIIISLPLVFDKDVIKSRIIKYLILSLLVFGIFITSSRTVIAGYSIIYIFTYLLFQYYHNPRNSIKKILIIMCTIIVSYVVYYFIESFITLLQSFRVGSTNSRIDLMRNSIIVFINEANILTGLGYKIRSQFMNEYPIGSHSTLIGMLVKTGIIGLIATLSSWALIINRCNKYLKLIAKKRTSNSNILLVVSIVTTIFWQLFEDIDAPVLAAFTYFFIIGYLINKYREIRQLINFKMLPL